MTIKRRLVPAAVAALILGVPALSLGGGAHTTLTSRGPDGPALGVSTYWRSISGDGSRVVFTSDDDGLPGADGTKDVFLRDVKKGKTKLISRSSSGEPVNANAGDDPAISANGRFVAFTTGADNLPGGVGGVYVRDARKKTTRLVSVTTAGDPADEDAGRPVLSANGRLVSFELDDDDFPGADGTVDAYVHDRKTGTTELMSKSSDGTPVDTNTSVYPTISGDGRFVAFRSDSDVLPGATGTADLYLRDRKKDQTTLVSRTPGGDPAGGGLANAGSVSFDGRFVAFESSASSLDPDPVGGSAFVRDRKRHKTILVSRQPGGDAAIGYTTSISGGGRYIAYESEDDDLPGTDGATDVYRYDRKTKQTTLVSRASNGDPGADESFYPSISGNGSFVSFNSRADNLSGNDDNAYANSFLRGPLP
jgi:Tol biopolymer transport system component